MDEIKAFSNPELGEIRAIIQDGEPWFVGKDVAELLGYSNSRDALSKHVDEEDKNTVAICDGNKGNPNQTIINESGLYSLIFSSKLPAAKQFKRWVTSEVLPEIRRTGAYQSRFYEEENQLAPISRMYVVTRNGFDVQFFFTREQVQEYINCVLKHRAPMKPKPVLHLMQSEFDEDEKRLVCKEVFVYRCENHYSEMFLIEEN